MWWEGVCTHSFNRRVCFLFGNIMDHPPLQFKIEICHCNIVIHPTNQKVKGLLIYVTTMYNINWLRCFETIMTMTYFFSFRFTDLPLFCWTTSTKIVVVILSSSSVRRIWRGDSDNLEIENRIRYHLCLRT